MAEIDQTVKLSDEQKQKMRTIMQVCDKALDEFDKRTGPQLWAADDVRSNAHDGGDRGKIDQAQKAFIDLHTALVQDRMKIWRTSQTDLMKVLTDKQKDAWRTAQMLEVVDNRTSPVTLSDEQMKKFFEACADLLRDDATLGRRGGEEWSKVGDAAQAVLTDEQKAMIAKDWALHKVRVKFRGAELSDKQKTQLAAEYDTLLKTIPKAPRSGNEVHDCCVVKVISLLTDEQKDAELASQLYKPWRETDAAFERVVKLTDEQKKQLAAAREAVDKDGGLSKAGPSVGVTVKHFKQFLGSLKADQKTAMLQALIESEWRPLPSDNIDGWEAMEGPR